MDSDEVCVELLVGDVEILERVLRLGIRGYVVRLGAGRRGAPRLVLALMQAPGLQGRHPWAWKRTTVPQGLGSSTITRGLDDGPEVFVNRRDDDLT